jgi:hypothetical protein
MMEWEILLFVPCLALIAVWGIAELIARSAPFEDDRVAHWKRIIERNGKESQWGKR